ncbi:MAG TPA: hypothetical protein VLU94_03045 [Candidatus Nitrosotalea sp.]|nr:hypothetical protein [Candidatus Nitrosotalea sp.]
MADLNLRSITNNFRDARLASLASWSKAGEINPRDRGGPYVILQDGYDPEDPKMIADEFVLGRSGKWLSIGLFYKMPVADRRAEFVFGTAAEVMQMMGNLPSKVVMLRPGVEKETTPANPETDEMAAALRASKGGAPGAAS